MKTIEPSAVWKQPWLGPCCAVADFNADGHNELFCLQTAGAHANSFLDPRLNTGAGYKTGVEDQELFCMTLADSEAAARLSSPKSVPPGPNFLGNGRVRVLADRLFFQD